MDLKQVKSSGKDELTLDWVYANASASPGPLDRALEDDGIATRLHCQSLDMFRRIYQLKRQTCPSDKSIPKMKEALGKLYLWGDAFPSGQLDRALESSDEVRFEVLDSLSAITRLLLRVWRSQAQINHDVSGQKFAYQLENLTAQTKNSITSTQRNLAGKKSPYESDSDTDEYSSDEDDCEYPDHGEHDDFVGIIELHLKWLSQLSPTLEQNLVSKQKTQVAKVAPCTSSFIVSTPAQYYVSLVRERYKLADERLVERLGEANWQRHLNVRKSSPVVENKDEENGPAASSVFRPFSAFHDSGIGTSVNYVAEDSRSHTSFLSSASKSEVEAARVPATPAEVQDGVPFECFICKRTLNNIKNRVDWKMHVFSDLRPYICTFPQCQDELVQFDHRSGWADHEFKKHRIRKAWNCLACSKRLTAVDEWELHLQKVHNVRLTGQNLQAACRMALIEEERPAEQEECPLCRKVINQSRRGFIAHAARHMEQIALAVLPRDVDESESDSCSTSIEHTSPDKTQKTPNVASDETPEIDLPSTSNLPSITMPPPANSRLGACIPCRTAKVMCNRISSDDPHNLMCDRCRITGQECFPAPTKTRNADEAELESTLPSDNYRESSTIHSAQLERTSEQHMPSVKEPCPHCGKRITSSNLRRHIHDIHQLDKERFPCPVPSCSETFARSEYLIKHIKRRHPNFEEEESILARRKRRTDISKEWLPQPSGGMERSPSRDEPTLANLFHNPLDEADASPWKTLDTLSAIQNTGSQFVDMKHASNTNSEDKLDKIAPGTSGQKVKVPRTESGIPIPPAGFTQWLCGLCGQAVMSVRHSHCTNCHLLRQHDCDWII